MRPVGTLRRPHQTVESHASCTDPGTVLRGLAATVASPCTIAGNARSHTCRSPPRGLPTSRQAELRRGVPPHENGEQPFGICINYAETMFFISWGTRWDANLEMVVDGVSPQVGSCVSISLQRTRSGQSPEEGNSLEPHCNKKHRCAHAQLHRKVRR